MSMMSLKSPGGTTIRLDDGPASAAIYRAWREVGLGPERTATVTVRAGTGSFQDVVVSSAVVDAFTRQLATDPTVAKVTVNDTTVFQKAELS